MLSKLLERPERPFAAILGGAKVSDKIKVIDHLLTKVDLLVLGGGMANTFLLAQGKAVGKSLAEPDRVEDARRILSTAANNGVRVVLPVDVIVAKEVTRGTEYKTLQAEKIPASWHIVDLGKASQDLIVEALADVQTVFWNGPLGVFEIPSFAHGTKAVARMLAERADAGATVVVGGGDSVAAVTQQGLADRMTHISTGGGASLEFLEGRELPGVDRPARSPAGRRAGQGRRRRHAHEHRSSTSSTPARSSIRAAIPTVEVDVVLGRRLGRPGGGAVRGLDRRPRGGRAARRRQGAVRRQGRPARGRQRDRHDRAGALRARRGRPGRHRRAPVRARRHAEQGRARRERDPRRLARLRPRGGRVVRPAALPLPRRGRRADAAGPDVQHPQRRQARPGLDRLPGVHGHAGRRRRPSPRRCGPGAEVFAALRGDPPRRRPCHRPGRRGRLRADRCRRTRPPSRSSCAPSSGPATGRARTSRSRSTRRRARARRAGTGRRRRHRRATSWRARAGRSIRASSSTCGPTGPRATRSSRSRTASPRTTGPAGASSPRGSAARIQLVGDDLLVTNTRSDRARHRRGRAELRPHQAQPDRDADRDDRGDRPRPARRLDGDGRRIARARPRTRRSPTSSSRWAPARSRPAPRRAPSGSPSTTGCSGSRASSATARATSGRSALDRRRRRGPRRPRPRVESPA